MLPALLFTFGCADGGSPFVAQFRNGRRVADFALAVGARTPLALVSDPNASKSRYAVEDRTVVSADPTVADFSDGILSGLAEGDTTLTITGNVQGRAGTLELPIRVRASSSQTWNVDGEPVSEDLLVLVGGDIGFAVHHHAADGTRLIVDGLDVEPPQHATLKPAAGMPEFSLVQFQSDTPGRFALPGTEHHIEVVETWDTAQVEGTTLTLLHEGRTPYVRAPGPRIESLSDCDIPARATGTNPFTIDAKSATQSVCKAQLTLEGRVFSVDLTLEK